MNDFAIKAMFAGPGIQYKCLAFKYGKIGLPNGLDLQYPGINANLVNVGKSNWFRNAPDYIAVQDASYIGARGRSKLYGGLLTENVVQALARIKAADGMREIAERYSVVLMEHDAVVFLAPTKEADEALKWATGVMSTPPSWAPTIPLAAEGKHDVCYPQ